jgi:Undecaprenyl-phosphate galactose phosphotransferase WbaP
MAIVLVLTDLMSLLLSGFLAVAIRAAMGEMRAPQHYHRMAPLLVIFLLVYAWKGLYPAVGIDPVEELHRLSLSTSIVFLLVTGFTFWARSAMIYSRLAFAFAWVLALFLIPISRWLIRHLACRIGVWGEPVAVIGYGPQGHTIVNYLLGNLRLGLRPILVIDGFESSSNHKFPIPRLILTSQDAAVKALRAAGISTALLMSSEISDTLQQAIVDQERFGFKRMIMISDLRWIGSRGVNPYDLGGFLGLEVRHNLLNSWEQNIKRIMDIILVIFGSIIALPLSTFIAVSIYFDSPGRILYGHIRLGKNGEEIVVWKFRTMIENADEVLDEYLISHPEALTEWMLSRKLKNDPRVTRIGKVLRKWSLDELPQLWNVFKGEMSFVGPRPIVEEEVHHYADCFNLYTRVRPGMTGLWQVSGRNEVNYDYRVRLDEYYVRNWSIWLDIYIAARTLGVVLSRKGAF